MPVAVRGQSTAVNANCLGSTCTRSFLFSPHSLNSDPSQRLTKALGSQHFLPVDFDRNFQSTPESALDPGNQRVLVGRELEEADNPKIIESRSR